MAYANRIDLELYLGRSLSNAEEAQCPFALDAATAMIDAHVGRAFGSSTVTAELQSVYGRVVHLDRTPVSSMTLVRARSMAIGAAWETLANGSGYELIDAVAGVLVVSAAEGALLEATYTVSSTIPADVKLATAMLAARLLTVTGNAQTLCIKRETVLSSTVEYRESAVSDAQNSLPPDVMALLTPYRQLVFA